MSDTPETPEPSEPSDAPDLAAMLQQAQEMLGVDLAQMQEASAAAFEAEVTGSSGGGAVQVVLQAGEFRSVRIDPAAVDPDDISMLEDLVLAALNDCMAKMNELMPGAPDVGDLFGGA
jgi:DNA-binding YbaB/EbfC family protein